MAATIPPTISLLQMCGQFEEVRQVHGQLIVSGLINRRPNASRLVGSYVAVSEMGYAISVFEAKACRDVFAYNTIMRGSRPSGALLLYKKLLLRGIVPDNYSYTFVLKACSCLKAVSEGKQVHCQIIKAGKEPDTHIHSSLIHMYASSGQIDCAERVLAEFLEENVLAKNSMVSGYLIQGHVEKARSVFDNMRTKDVASWSTMVSGYTKNGMYWDAMEMFRDMVASGVAPNESTLVSALSACAHLGARDLGLWIHAYMDKMGTKRSNTLGTALIDMYAKCGSIESARKVFEEMPLRDVVTWGAMISGLAIHGRAEECFRLLEEMVAGGTYPNGVIFVAVLSACSHGGLVEEGRHYFNRMVGEFGIRPSVEHYGCMVDLLGRAGLVAEAEEVIESMTEEPNSVVWGALLSACSKYRDVRRGKRALRELEEMEPGAGDWYKLAGIMYARAGRKGDAEQVRRMMKEREMESRKGWSCIQVQGMLHHFEVGATHHDKATQIYKITEDLNRSMLIQDAPFFW